MDEDQIWIRTKRLRGSKKSIGICAWIYGQVPVIGYDVNATPSIVPTATSVYVPPFTQLVCVPVITTDDVPEPDHELTSISLYQSCSVA